MPVHIDELQDVALLPDQRFVCSDGVLLKCNISDGSFVPEKIINKVKLLTWIRTELTREDPATNSEAAAVKAWKLRPQGELDNYWTPYSQQKRRKQSEGINDASFSPRRHSSVCNSPTSSGILLKNEDSDASGLDDVFSDDVIKEPCSPTSQLKNERIRDQLLWLKETGGDLVTMETMHSVKEAKEFLDVFANQKMAVAFDVKINKDKSMTISYQIVHDFKEDFMMLELNSGHFLFLEPF